MSTRIKKMLRSVSSASSRASSDRSYADTYFDEIGFKMGDNSCLGSTESPDNLDGEQILFHKDDKLFYEPGDDDDDDDDIVINNNNKDEDQKSADTATASNHHQFLSPPVGLSPDDVHGGKHQQQHEQQPKDIMNLPLDYVVHEHPKNKRRLNNSFGSKEDKEGAVVYHHDDYRDSKTMEYSPNRPHPITTLGAHDNNNTKVDTGRSAKTWFFNLDTVVIGETDFLHKGTTSTSVEAYKERAFRVKATIWFLFFLGTFLLVSAIVVLMLAFEQGRQAEYDRVRNNNNNNNNKNVDLIDHDDAFLTPLAEGWEIEEDLKIDWNWTITEAPSTSSTPTSSPTIWTTSSPTTTPPTLPPTALFTPAQEALVNTLVNVSMDPNLKQGIAWGSPQFHAIQWLADDPFLSGYSDNRILQRWAVATFYFSTKGDSWKIPNGSIGTNDNQAIARQRQEEQFNKNPWMIPTTNECWWFTSHDNDGNDDDEKDQKDSICDGSGQLEILNLNGIGLKGSLPTELGFLTMLKQISLPNNEIEGSIPHTFGRLTLLESLDLQHNEISHGIPLELGNLQALKELKANDNKLEGSIPIELFSMLDLETLHLESNKISGEIPTALVALPYLKELTIQNNEIVGTMPFETCHLTHLIADCDEMICECCTQCCIGCQGEEGTNGQIVDTVPTLGPTKAQTTTKAPTKTPTDAPTKQPSTPQPTTKKPTSKPTSRPTRTPTGAPTRTPSTTQPTTRKPTSKPTSRPTRTPTGAPTRKPIATEAPTRKPTNPPTGAPTRKPIGPAPDGIHILVSVGNDGLPEQLYPLKMCQGDCDRDVECAGDLVCYERVGIVRVPGCLGQGVANRDYCTHPHFIAEAETGDNADADTNAGAKPSVNAAANKNGN